MRDVFFVLFCFVSSRDLLAVRALDESRLFIFREGFSGAT